MPRIEDIKAAETLAKRLMGGNTAETLNNVLEWMERNIVFWWKRAYVDIIATMFLHIGLAIIVLLISLPICILLFALFVLLLKVPILISLIASLVLTSFLMLYFTVKTPPFLRLLFVVIGSVLLYNLAVEALKMQPTPVEVFTSFLRIGVIYWIMAGGSLFTLIYLFTMYLSLANRLEGVSKLTAVVQLIDLTFTPELPVSSMLKLKRGVCRDYARLTASILINLFPDHKIYFIVIPNHVATGIEVNDRIYVLDQRLPVMPLSTWLNYWRRSCPLKILLLQRYNNDTLVAKPIDKQMCVEALTPFNLSRELENIVERIYQAIVNGESTVSYRLPGYARLFEVDDEIAYISLTRKIKLVLEQELTSLASLVKDISISRQEYDLLINLYIVATRSSTRLVNEIYLGNTRTDACRNPLKKQWSQVETGLVTLVSVLNHVTLDMGMAVYRF